MGWWSCGWGWWGDDCVGVDIMGWHGVGVGIMKWWLIVLVFTMGDDNVCGTSWNTFKSSGICFYPSQVIHCMDACVTSHTLHGCLCNLKISGWVNPQPNARSVDRTLQQVTLLSPDYTHKRHSQNLQNMHFTPTQHRLVCMFATVDCSDQWTTVTSTWTAVTGVDRSDRWTAVTSGQKWSVWTAVTSGQKWSVWTAGTSGPQWPVDCSD